MPLTLGEWRQTGRVRTSRVAVRPRIPAVECGSPAVDLALARRIWRYRVGDYRLICSIEDRVLRILVIEIGNRRDVYR